VSLGRIPISARSNPAQSGTARLESCLDARERGLLEKNRRGKCTSARYEVARSDRDSRPAGQQADPRRAVVEYASLHADDVAGAIRPHRETRIGEIELFVMDAILAVPCTLTPPALKAMDESLMKAWPAFVLPARLTPFPVKCRIAQRMI
jgi:hypothetical protein